MKTRKIKKKINRKRTAEFDATAKFSADSSKEPAGVDALGLLPQSPLGTGPLGTDEHRD